MKIEWLEGFSIFAEELNFTRAAERQNITQPAFFRQIQNLADALGVQLYVKSGRNLILTESGEEVSRFARDISERMREFQNGFAHGGKESEIVVAAGQGTYLYLLGGALRETAGSRRLKLLTTTRDQTLDAVRSGRAHLGVTVLDEKPKDLAADVLLKFRPILAVHEGHELADRKRLTVGQLKGVGLIVPPEPSALRADLGRRLHEAGAGLEIALEASGWELMLHFVSLGFGAAVVNGCCRLPKGVIAVPISDLPTTDYYLVYRKEQYFFPALTVLRKKIRDKAVEG